MPQVFSKTLPLLIYIPSAAEVTIHLKNQGEEAYRPNDYGQSIVITRHFTKNGASTWKFKNKDGVVVSTKREELTAICQHMNIQVDNPMNILTQGRNLYGTSSFPLKEFLIDSARKFLSSSTPNDKYHVRPLSRSNTFAVTNYFLLSCF